MYKQNRTIILGMLFIFGISLSAASAQSNRVIDQVLEQKQASFASTLYLVQTAAGQLPEELEPREAVEAFEAPVWHLPEVSADAKITLGQYSQLLMHAFEIPGGVMYKAFPGPRYATREIHYRGFISSSGTPGQHVSGFEVVNILRRVLEWEEDST